MTRTLLASLIFTSLLLLFSPSGRAEPAKEKVRVPSFMAQVLKQSPKRGTASAANNADVPLKTLEGNYIGVSGEFRLNEFNLDISDVCVVKIGNYSEVGTYDEKYSATIKSLRCSPPDASCPTVLKRAVLPDISKLKSYPSAGGSAGASAGATYQTVLGDVAVTAVVKGKSLRSFAIANAAGTDVSICSALKKFSDSDQD